MGIFDWFKKSNVPDYMKNKPKHKLSKNDNIDLNKDEISNINSEYLKENPNRLPDDIRNENGENIIYYTNGNIEEKYIKINGKRDGLYKSFYENGQLRSEINYNNGIEDGKSSEYFENGQISKVYSFKLGQKNGQFVSYFESGQIHFEYNFLNDLEDGIQKNWYENGQLDIEKNMKNGVENGWRRQYFLNGQIESELEYKDGEPIGTFKKWNKEGDLIDEIKYSNVFKGVPEDFEKIVSGTFSNSSEKNESKEEVERIDFNEIESEPNNGDILYLLNGKLFSGILYTKYDNGNLMSEFEIKKGRQFGTQKMYEKNGDLRYENYIDKYTEVI
ncbi:MAG: toxin-antitoxin system YwqK family antitoxin [Flavobacteriales bacterium]|jgi:antitoxin component YwqK of YwqJK toxin-antitoxin module